MGEELLENDRIKVNIETKENNDFIIVNIKEQQRYRNYRAIVNIAKDGTIVGEEVKDGVPVCILTQSVVEYSEPYTLYLKGDVDIDTKEKEVVIPKEIWKYIKIALLYLGATVDGENQYKDEEEKEKTEKPKIDYSKDMTPTVEEIKRMIELVDLDTFLKIIKSRLVKDGINSEDIKKINKIWARKYLEKWAYSKYHFYKIFGDKLLLEKEIKIENNKEEVRYKVSEIGEKLPLYKHVLAGINIQCFVENKVIKNDISNYFFDDKRVREGMKLTKLISMYGNKDLDMEVSKIYQDNGKGNIYISIDPIDYLTVSINKSGWASCHNFFNGCFKNAGLSYMIDETSLVAYRSETQNIYNGKFPFEWNSKRWRQMVYVSKKSSIMAFSRQYPNENSTLAKEIRVLLEDVMSKYYGSENAWRLTTDLRRLDAWVERGDNAPLYNDIDNGYNHKAVKAKDDIMQDKERIVIGDKVQVFNGSDEVDGDDNLWW